MNKFIEVEIISWNLQQRTWRESCFRIDENSQL